MSLVKFAHCLNSVYIWGHHTINRVGYGILFGVLYTPWVSWGSIYTQGGSGGAQVCVEKKQKNTVGVAGNPHIHTPNRNKRILKKK